MTKLDVINKIHQQSGIHPVIGRAIVESFFEVIKVAITQGKAVHIRQFGSFQPKRRSAKIARSISKNTSMPLEACTIPNFKPSAEFVNKVRLSVRNTTTES